jgi:hypothetical protein
MRRESDDFPPDLQTQGICVKLSQFHKNEFYLASPIVLIARPIPVSPQSVLSRADPSLSAPYPVRNLTQLRLISQVVS